MMGAVLNINTPPDAVVNAFKLDHAEAKSAGPREFSKVEKDALSRCKAKPLFID